MKNRLEKELIFRIQKRISFYFTIATGIAILQNIALFINNQETSSFNIISLTIIGILFFCTSLKDASYLRYLQVFILVSCSIIGILINETNNPIWTFFIILGGILSYQYGFFAEKFISKLVLILFIVFAAFLIKLFFLSEEFEFIRILAQAILSFGYLIIVIDIIKKEIDVYKEDYKKNLVNIKLGVNYSGLIHNLNFRGAHVYINILNKKIKKNNSLSNESKKEFFNTLTKFTSYIKSKEELRDNILSATKQNRMTTRSVTGINETINTVLEVFKADSTITNNIQFNEKSHEEEIYINCIPYQLFMIIQNLIQNSVDSLEKIDGKAKVINIKTYKEENLGILKVEDNGRGFEDISGNEEIYINEIVHDKKYKGFGLNYIHENITSNNGTIKFFNNTEGGASAVMTFVLDQNRGKNE